MFFYMYKLVPKFTKYLFFIHSNDFFFESQFHSQDHFHVHKLYTFAHFYALFKHFVRIKVVIYLGLGLRIKNFSSLLWTYYGEAIYKKEII